jgi:hypothetical protein
LASLPSLLTNERKRLRKAKRLFARVPSRRLTTLIQHHMAECRASELRYWQDRRRGFCESATAVGELAPAAVTVDAGRATADNPWAAGYLVHLFAK